MTVETIYDQKAMTAMARVLRKTVRRKRSRRAHIFGEIAMVLGILLAWYAWHRGEFLSFRGVVTLAVVLVMGAALIWEDAINGYVAGKRLLPGTEQAVTTFLPESFSTETEAGISQWNYEKIEQIGETGNYIVFVFSPSHGQAYDKRRIHGATEAEFRTFLEEKTGRTVESV